MMYKYEVSIECEDCQRASSKIVAREEGSVISAGCKNCGFGVDLICEDGDNWSTRTGRGGKFSAQLVEK